MRTAALAAGGLVLLAALVYGLRTDSGATANIAVFALAGFACGFLNTVASSGSAVSLPLLMLFGMNAHTANATNRLPVLIGAATAVFSFARKGQIDWKLGLTLVVPVIAGSLLGALVAELVPAKDMALLITFAVLAALVLLFTKVKKIIDEAMAGEVRKDAVVLAAMFGIGFWLGLIVLDGGTYMLLALVVLVRKDLLHANALKNLMVLGGTLVAFIMFAADGSIDWGNGAILSVGSVVGGFTGVRVAQFATAKVWVFRLLVLVITLELAHIAIVYALDIA